MIRLLARPVALGLAAALAPLALGLAACSETASTEAAADGAPIAAIPAPAGTSWTETVTLTPEGGYKLGNPNAPLQLIEFASHTCGACATFSANGKPPLKDKYVASGVVSFELRTLVRDPIDLTIARLVRCGPKETMQPLSDQAWAGLNSIFAALQGNQAAYEAAASQPASQRFVTIAQAAGLIEFFAARGLSADQARACLTDVPAMEALANTSAAQAESLGIQGTPTFLLNGKKLDVTQWDALEPILQRAGAR